MTPRNYVSSPGMDAGDTPSSSSKTNNPPEIEKWTPESLARWADLIAVGSVRMPRGLPQQQFDELAAAVSDRRRDRLIRFLAELIAKEVYRDADHRLKRNSS